MEFSVFYAKLIGLYFIIAAIAMVINSQRMKAVIMDSGTNNTFIIVTGVLSLLFGLTVVLTHNVWVGWPILITVIGYLSIVRGVVRLFFSNWVAKVIPKFAEHTPYYVATAVVLLLGVILTYGGFVGFKV